MNELNQDEVTQKGNLHVLKKLFSWKNANSPLDRKSQEMNLIWQSIIEANSSVPIKLSRAEKHKVPKQNLQKYLSRRYSNRVCEIILQTFKFPVNFNLEEYTELIQNWIYKEDKEKLKLGFMIHDMDSDGRISPKDIVDFQTRFCSETSYLIPFDIILLTNCLMKKTSDYEDKDNSLAESILIEAKK